MNSCRYSLMDTVVCMWPTSSLLELVSVVAVHTSQGYAVFAVVQ